MGTYEPSHYYLKTVLEASLWLYDRKDQAKRKPRDVRLRYYRSTGNLFLVCEFEDEHGESLSGVYTKKPIPLEPFLKQQYGQIRQFIDSDIGCECVREGEMRHIIDECIEDLIGTTPEYTDKPILLSGYPYDDRYNSSPMLSLLAYIEEGGIRLVYTIRPWVDGYEEKEYFVETGWLALSPIEEVAEKLNKFFGFRMYPYAWASDLRHLIKLDMARVAKQYLGGAN